MTNLTFQSRLYLYDNIIGKYDLLDKHKFSTKQFSFLKNLKILYTTQKLTNKSLVALLFNEFFTYKQYNFNHFKINSCKYLLFIYLDFLMNTFFLEKKLIFNSSISSVKETKFFIKPTKFFVLLKNEFNQISDWNVLSFEFETSSICLKNSFSYYFIPI